MPLSPLSVLRPEVAAWVAPHSPVQADEFYTTSPGTITLTCQRCGKDRVVRARTAFGGARDHDWCRSCAQRLRKPAKPVSKVRPDLAKLFTKSSPVQPQDVSVHSDEVATVICTQCGIEHQTSVAALAVRRTPHLCALCKSYSDDEAPREIRSATEADVAERYPHLVPFFAEENPLPADKMAWGPRISIIVKCPSCKGLRRVRLRHATDPAWSGLCSTCAAVQRKEAEGPIATTHPEVAKRFADSSPIRPEDVTAGSSRNAIFVCVHCERPFESKVANQTRPKATGCCGPCRNNGARRISEEAA